MSVAVEEVVNDDPMDVMPTVRSVLEPVAAESGMAHPMPQSSTARLGRLIEEALLDFDPDAPSSVTRLKSLTTIAHTSLPKSWRKKAV
jgi:hypothetical protein